MPYKGLPENLVARVTPGDVERYAQATGWVRVPEVNGQIVVYRHPSSEVDQLVVPLVPEFDDYGRRMAEVVSRLAETEARPALEVLDDLLLPPADVLRFRITGPSTEQDSLPLERGIGLLAGVKKSLLAAACSVIRPQAFHPRLSRAEANQFVEACRLGQTERGSFTVTVVCPLSPVDSPTPLLEDTPFGRQVTRLLVRSVAAIAEAPANDPDRLLHPVPAAAPLSANLCEGLLDMQPGAERATLTLGVTWARTLPPPAGERLPNTVHLRQEQFPLIGQLAQRLRPSAEPQQQVFAGFVEELRGVPGEDGRVQGEVGLSLIDPEGETLRAKAVLDADAYDQALEAHRHTLLVHLQGVLRRGFRTHRVDPVADFQVIQRRPGR
jgi:hypothetical protein